jgi:hypothetical protein
MWKATKVTVMMSYVDLEWERQVGGITQHMMVCLYSEDMYVKVTCSTAIKEEEHRFARAFFMQDMYRRPLHDDEALERLFNEVFFNGKDC